MGDVPHVHEFAHHAHVAEVDLRPLLLEVVDHFRNHEGSRLPDACIVERAHEQDRQAAEPGLRHAFHLQFAFAIGARRRRLRALLHRQACRLTINVRRARQDDFAHTVGPPPQPVEQIAGAFDVHEAECVRLVVRRRRDAGKMDHVVSAHLGKDAV